MDVELPVNLREKTWANAIVVISPHRYISTRYLYQFVWVAIFLYHQMRAHTHTRTQAQTHTQSVGHTQ